MKEGDVVIVAMPQADGTTKNRPAIILRKMPPFQDMLVCGVSTQIHQEVKDFDETIGPADGDFVGSSLVGKSLIRLGFLTVVPQSHIAGSIGSISSIRHKRLLEKLSNHLMQNAS
jgi:mRNA interferase MazF